ncbi:putative pyruvate, phosphate dikinase regulatory protein, chloroplastic [Bidens hawaiensis]|uniref:putative pyruvate, phosphate dikinase regulatory protein, chloroplastic n=1 Tax=Bidens hawaiensis TaxID=980011 RepID=UPI00404B6D22
MKPTITEPAAATVGNPTSNRSLSSQLSRWSRARVIKSGRKLDRHVQPKQPQITENADVQFIRSEGGEAVVSSSSEDETGGTTEEAVVVKGKEIYMVSDGSGRTAEHSVNAALGQFEHFMIDGGCPVYTRLFSGINDMDRLMEIIMQAAKQDAILIYTLADEKLADSARQACKSWNIQSTDVLRPITDAISSYLGLSPSRLPRGAPGRQFPLTEQYFKRIDAIEFTIKQDDGAYPQNLHKADIVIAGVSRSGKTPLSIYLAQKGFKVANVPIVKGVDLPKSLFEVDPKKVFALTLNPVMLQTIRLERAKSSGYLEDEKSDYAEMVHVREELDYANKIFTQNPAWPVIEVTGKAIEEIAAIILRIYQDRESLMPMISKLY